jgi:hypothetical protein
MYTGRLSRHEMEEYHPLELASIEAGDHPMPQPEVRRERLRRFVPTYGSVAIVALVGVYLFVTFEKTAIDTIVPSEQVEVFAPVETLPPGAATTLPPTTTSVPTTVTTTSPTTTDPTTTEPGTSADSWATVAGLFDPRCTSCHGASQQIGGVDLSSYDAAVAAVIVPGDAAASLIVQVMEAGGHPGRLIEEDLTRLVAWIDAGAVEE